MEGFRQLPASRSPSPNADGSSSPQHSAREDPVLQDIKSAIATESVAFTLQWVAHCVGGKRDLNPNRFTDHGLKIFSATEFMPIQTRVFPSISRKVTETLKRGTTWDSSAIDQVGESEMNLKKGIEECDEMIRSLQLLTKNALSLLLHSMSCDSLLRILILVPHEVLNDLKYCATQWKRNHEKGVRVLRLNEKEQGIGRYYLSKALLRCGEKELKPTEFFDYDFDLLKKTIDTARGISFEKDSFYPFLTVAFGGDKAPEDIAWALINNTAPGTDFPYLDFNNCIKLSATAVLHSVNHFANIQEIQLANVQLVDDVFLRNLAETRLPILKVLNLAGCTQITDNGLVPLMESISKYHPIRLTHLNLAECINITDGGLQAVGRLIMDLEDLCIFSCPQYTDRGLITFVRPTAKLRSMNYAGAYHITPGLIRQLYMQNSQMLLYREPEEFPHRGFVIDEGDEDTMDIDNSFRVTITRERSRRELIRLEEMAKAASANAMQTLAPRPLRKRGSVEMIDADDIEPTYSKRRASQQDPYGDPYA